MSIGKPIEAPSTLLVMAGVGDRVRQVRLERDWTQEELAKKAGVAQSTIAELERKPNRGSKEIVEIALALGVSPVWLALNKGPKTLTKIQAVAFGWSEEETSAAETFVEQLRARRTR